AALARVAPERAAPKCRRSGCRAAPRCPGLRSPARDSSPGALLRRRRVRPRPARIRRAGLGCRERKMRPSDASAYIECPAAIIVTRLARRVVQISSARHARSACRARSAAPEPTRVTGTYQGRKPMPSTITRRALATAGGLAGALILAMAASVGTAGAQTYGFATLQPGTLNHTTASALAKVLKEKAGLNVLVQPTAGAQVIVPLVARGEAEIGIANAMEVHDGLSKGFKELRIIAAAHALRVGFFVRKDGDIRTVADLKGKRVPYGFSAMRALEPTVRAILATASLSEKDIKPILVPNVIRSADDFASGAADAFYFAFGAPKVREVDVTVGGIRMAEIDEQGMPAARK